MVLGQERDLAVGQLRLCRTASERDQSVRHGFVFPWRINAQSIDIKPVQRGRVG
jgi:hypothetical protein